MNDSKISVRYAKALFELASEQGQTEKVSESIATIRKALESIPALKAMLINPVIEASAKKELLDKIFATSIDKLTGSFLNLLIKNRREEYLLTVCLNFQALYRESKGVKWATITSAKPMSADTVEQLGRIMSEKFKSKIEITEYTDPSMIGGFMLQVDDQLLDAGLSARLKRLRQTLIR